MFLAFQKVGKQGKSSAVICRTLTIAMMSIKTWKDW